MRARAAPAISDGVVKIGVLDDMSGVFADQQGMGDFVAAHMAAEDFGGHVLGAPDEVIQADLQNKPMSACRSRAAGSMRRRSMRFSGWAIRRWRWRCRNCAISARRSTSSIAAGTTDLTGKACSPYGVALDLRQLLGGEGTGRRADEARQVEVVLHHLRLRVRPFAGGQCDGDPAAAWAARSSATRSCRSARRIIRLN